MSEAETASSGTAPQSEPPAVPVRNKSGGSKALKITLWVVGILGFTAGVLAVIGLLLPSTYIVEESIVIKAAPADIHPHVADLRKWPKWTPYNEENMPGLEFEYGEVQHGMVSSETWTEPRWGAGKLTIDYADPGEGIKYVVEMDAMDEPIKGTIRYIPLKDGTKVTWTARGRTPANPFSRWMHVLFVTRGIEDSYSNGLEKLKQVAEDDYAARRKKLAKTAVEPSTEPGPAMPGGPGGPRFAGGPGGGRGGGPGGGGPGGGSRRGGRGARKRPTPQQLIAGWMERDANKDGKVSKEEASERQQRFFDRVDANKDGFVDEAELKALAARFGQGGGGRRGGFGRGRPSGGSPGGGPRKRPPSEDDGAKTPAGPVPANRPKPANP